MSRQGSLFDPGIVLLWAEKGLTSISLALENKTEKLLKKWRHKDRRKQQTKKKKKQQKKNNQELAKDQDSKLEYLEGIEKRNENSQVTERLTELDNTEEDVSHDAEIDRD